MTPTLEKFLEDAPYLYGWAPRPRRRKGEPPQEKPKLTDEQMAKAKADWEFASAMADGRRTCFRACRIRNWKWRHRKELEESEDYRRRVSDALIFSKIPNDFYVYIREKHRRLNFLFPIAKTGTRSWSRDMPDFTTETGHPVNETWMWWNMPLSVRLSYGRNIVDGMDGACSDDSDCSTWHNERDFGEWSLDDELRLLKKAER